MSIVKQTRKEYLEKYQKAWLLKNKEKKAQYNKKNREKNKERYKKQSAEYYLKNKEKLLAKGRIKNRERQAKRRLAVLEKLGNKCIKCGFSDWRALQIDHINGGGNKERKDIGTSQFHKNILNGSMEKYQLLCANCNWIKRYENNERPRKYQDNIVTEK